jgi:CBS-domain-containing membrane protein
VERLSQALTAAEIMTVEVVAANPNTPVAEVAAGALIILAVALLVNNLAPQRRYPEFWW